MSTSITKNCPHCKKDFQARRKNQLYCSTECKTDANNAVLKGRYALFKKQAPENEILKEKLKTLRTFISEQIIVLKTVEKLDEKTILYEGRIYKFTALADPPPLPISLKKGGGVLMPGRKIIYLNEEETPSYMRDPYSMPKYSEYVMVKK
jgi:endogenous inhibitor of DNA gyrase (YacG/DUF329 family)